MIKVVRYEHSKKKEWDEFIGRSINGIFQYKRDFISYHGDRFADHSLMAYDGHKLLSCIPGVCTSNEYCSHPGLGYGGIILAKGSAKKHRLILLSYVNYLSVNGIEKLTIKILPPIYGKFKNSLMEYYLKGSGCINTDVKLSALLDKNSPELYNPETKQMSKSALEEYELMEDSVETFHNALTDHLQSKYETTPLHSQAELSYLQEHFTENITTHKLTYQGQNVAGCCMFHYGHLWKLQYLYSSIDSGSRVLLLKLYEDYKSQYPVLDLGTSNSGSRGQINFGNLYFKESIGGQTFLAETIHIDIAKLLKHLEYE